MTHVGYRWTLLVVWVLAGCHLVFPYEEQPPPPDATTGDGNLAEVSTQDAAAPDLRADKTPAPDTVADLPADTALPDTALPDKALPDAALPDTALPDTTLPDKALPDKALPDKAQPDAPVPTATVSTLAGTGKVGKVNGPVLSATLNTPRGVEVGPSGEVYIADTANNLIRKIQGGQVSTYAGDGLSGATQGPFLSAQFNTPWGLNYNKVVGSRIYVADNGNHRIRVLHQGTSKVSNIAGSGVAGYSNASSPNSSQFKYPADVVYALAGGYYVADAKNHRVRYINGTTTSTLAGTGSAGYKDGAAASAQFNEPIGVAEHKGTVYVADKYNHAIREISGTQVKTLAGGNGPGHKDGAAGAAQFNFPGDVEVDANGVVYVADTYNHMIRVIKGGQVSTLAGCTKGYQDGAANIAQFYQPSGLALDAQGKVYVADTLNHRIRLITP